MDKAKLKQAIEDFNNDSAGREVGRIRRFAPPDHIDPASAKSDNINADIAFAVLTEAERQRQIEFQERMDGLRARYAELDEASLHALEEAARDLQDIRDRANRAKDGRRIYFDPRDGNHYDEDNVLVDKSDIDMAVYDRDAPNMLDYDAARGSFDESKAFRDELDSINPDQIEEGDFEELAEFERRLDAAQKASPQSVRKFANNPATPSESIENDVDEKGSLSSSLSFYRNTPSTQQRPEAEDWLRIV